MKRMKEECIGKESGCVIKREKERKTVCEEQWVRVVIEWNQGSVLLNWLNLLDEWAPFFSIKCYRYVKIIWRLTYTLTYTCDTKFKTT